MSPVEAVRQGLTYLFDLLRQRAWRLALLFVGLLLPLWVFAELAEEVHELEEFVFDAPLLMHLHAVATPALDRFFIHVSAAGYHYGVVPIDIALVLLLLVIRRWREALFTGCAFAGSALLNLATKHAFQRDRPSLWESVSPESTFSFPSGHAMGSMTLAMTVFLLAWHTRWRWPVAVAALVFVLLVGLSRIYLGVHYPSDIIGGWAAGMAWVVGVYLVIYRGGRPWRREPAQSSS
ncbi:phosphatase PAP2 family protein [Pseudoxanthomonas indica]|uniref:undecaprenyl-diphosphate phosphatase n=1 Tax=Pseudoxanthomonas indica TaxID=428993 RepID=A0A1T5LV59_9GAMM|nr:phosphatase PAP2 family protein [Pseudoxanthomonas indica]GGD39963.1 phosphatidylglycerophosphatase B [Pseudoxanthomonas indica]SKC79852.1 undecaprenyl-diphosphatase [Pseudoxanthomonas indica]